MMYHEKLAVAVKVNGQVLREQKDVVKLPFGSEYSILLKNLNPVRVQFKLQIDGADATSDTWIVIPANQSVEMERFIKNGNWKEGNKFKFIERTSAIEQHRGIGVEDGLIRVEYKKEYVAPYVPPPPRIPYNPPPFTPPFPGPWERRNPWNNPWRRDDRRRPSWESRIASHATRALHSSASGSAGHPTYANFLKSDSSTLDSNFAANSCTASNTANEAGITVAGSHSNQSFTSVPWFVTESETHVIVIHLKGQIGGQHVTEPITVEKKPTCSSCGKTNKGSAKFCSQCGTSLVIYA